MSRIYSIWDFFIMDSTGYTCNTCGKIFETEEEFLNRHKEKYLKPVVKPTE
jgi:hypothetical protein